MPPESVWLAFVQAALDQLGRLHPRDPTEAMLAIQIIATNAGAIDAYRMAFEAVAVPVQAARQRANAATLLRAGGWRHAPAGPTAEAAVGARA